MIMNKLFPNLTKDEQKKLRKLCNRENMWSLAWEQITGQAKGLVYTLYPFLEEMYKDDEKELIAAYERQFKYFNTNPNMGGFIVGLVYAMELKRSQDRNAVSSDAITDIRIALCGPFAGIGDSIIQNVLKVILVGLTMAMTASGNILGPILFFVIFGLLQRWIMDYLTYLGYSAGTKAIDKLFEGGLMDVVTKAVSVLGLFMIGAMTASTVSFSLSWIINIGDTSIDVQSILDSIFPGLWAIVLTLIVAGLIKKKVKIAYIVYSIMLICIVLAFFGIV